MLAIDPENTDWIHTRSMVLNRLAEASEKCDCQFGDPKELRRRGDEALTRLEAKKLIAGPS